jgi:hypothetical protein
MPIRVRLKYKGDAVYAVVRQKYELACKWKIHPALQRKISHRDTERTEG